MSGRVDVLIAGAGPTGLMLASELVRHGVSVRIIDEVAQRPRISKATAIMPRTLELLHVIGIVDKFLEAGVKLPGLVLYSGKHKIFELTSTDIDSPYPFVLGLEQFRTEEVLEDHLRHVGGAVERQTTLVDFSQDDEGVSAVLQLGGVQTETVRAGHLAGCDGAHSFVRHTLGLPFEGATITTDHFAVAYVGIDWDMPQDRMLEFHSPDGTVIATPLPAGLWSVMCEIDPSQWANAPQDAPTLDELQAIMSARSPVPCKLSGPLWTTYFRINHRQASAYRTGRVFLAGDAAHIHSPAGGQGMNTSMQDAINLAWKLALACKGRAPEALLGSYHEERHPVGKEVLALTTELQSELDLRNRLMRAFRDHAMGLIDHVGPARRTLARVLGELSYNYRHSSVVHEDTSGLVFLPHEARHPSFADCRAFASGPHAGDRAPDAAITLASSMVDGRPARLFDLLDTGNHTLLLFEGTHGKQASTQSWPLLKDLAVRVESAYADTIKPVVVTPSSERPTYLDWGGVTVYDGNGSLHHQYGARGECLYLVRPDGYIGYRSEPVDAVKLERYLAADFAQDSDR